MRSNKSTIIGSWLVLCLLALLAGMGGNMAQASPQAQDACANACACEGFDAETVWQHYQQGEVPPDSYSYSVYVYPSLCAEKYSYWVSGGVQPMEEILRKVGYFLDEQKMLCEKCRKGNAPPNSTPTLTVMQPSPAGNQPGKPKASPTPTSTPKPLLEFPDVQVQMEKAPLGKKTAPYQGIVADGVSTLNVDLINNDPERAVQVQVGVAGPGSMTTKDGKIISAALILPPSSHTQLLYVPPDYVDESLLTWSQAIPDLPPDYEDRSLLTRLGIIPEPPIMEFSRYRFIHAAPVKLDFSFSAAESSGSLQESLDVLVFRPPLVLVHGYYGSESTWDYLKGFLASHKFDMIAKKYDPDPEKSRIEDMADLLRGHVDLLLASYTDQYIKISRVDLVTHSMGGLISRTYIDSHLYDTVRKLIMLATPNHGANDWHRVTRYLVSSIGRKHYFAADQLNSDHVFFEKLNAGEEEMKHLAPEVEYANLIGRASCGPGCWHDGVVDISSAHLNGVPEYIFDHTIHSQSLLVLWEWTDEVNPFFKSSDVGITNSPQVAEKLLELLTSPIRRMPPDPKWSLALLNGSGEVSITRRFSGYLEMVREYPIPLQDFHEVRTGADGKALVSFYLRGREIKRIAIKPNTTVGFNVSAVGELSVWLKSGESRFVRFFNESGEFLPAGFNVTVGSLGNIPDGKLFTPVMLVRDLQTDFVVSADSPPGVNILEGSVWLDIFDAQGQPVKAGEILPANPDIFIRLDPTGKLVPQPVSQERWWTDPLYTQEYSVPSWAEDPSGRLLPFGLQKLLPPGISLEPAWLVMGGSLCLGIWMLLILAAGLLIRRKKQGKADRGGSCAGLPGCLMLLAAAGLALACLGVAVGVLWQMGILHPPFSQPSAGSPPFLEATRRPPPPVITLPEGPPVLPKDPSVPAEIPPANVLSIEGGWVIIPAEDGIWAMNKDGSGLTLLNPTRMAAPQNLQAGIAPERAELAFFAPAAPGAENQLALHLMSLPDGNTRILTPLLSPQNVPSAGTEMCDPKFEAARAGQIGNGLAWSPDGQRLAFTAALQGADSDVYIYTPADGSISRVSDEPGQAYDLHWSPDGSHIVYFSASCFGTGAGFNMQGVYALQPGKGSPVLIYQPDRESFGEEFITWLFSGRNAFFTATRSGCPLRDLRLVDMDTHQTHVIFPGCFEDYALGPTSMLAVLTSRDLSSEPGLSLFAEPDLDLPPVFIPNDEGRFVEFAPAPALFLLQSFVDGYKEVLSFDWNGVPGWYQGIGEFPVFSVDGNTWLWEMSGKFYLGRSEYETPVTLLDQPARFPLWYEDLTFGGTFQRALYFSEEPSSLYMLSSPGFQPVQLRSGLKPLSAPVILLR